MSSPSPSPSPSPISTPISTITITRVTSTSTSTSTTTTSTTPQHLATLASIFSTALAASDPAFEALMSLPSSSSSSSSSARSAYASTLSRLESALLHPAEEHVFQATETLVDAGSGAVVGEQVVGVAQWFVGYVQVEKVDPFAAPTDTVTTTTTTERQVQGKGEGFDHYDALVRPLRNQYISTIRGKRHVYLRRIATLPTHQRRGIASALMRWGVERADEAHLVAYLNARPAGRALYERCGWRAIASIPINAAGVGLVVEPMVLMLRLPRRT